ncbi:MAG: ABC transporter substrate-binding protein [Alphaproteobacteria bacterium]|nr:ABC transporter substrate-binding protein [Alphaproteobacteria bacterium]
MITATRLRQMGRRDLLTAASIVLAAPTIIRPVQAQPGLKKARVGFIEPGTQEANGSFLAAFRAGLAAHGWIEGQNVTILDRWVENRPERVPEIVAGLLADRVDVLVTAGALVTKGTISAAPGVPIVIVGVGDPVAFGFAQSLARPGGNVTGVASSAGDVLSKRLQLLLEVSPTAKRIAVLTDSNDPAREAQWLQPRDDALKLGLTPVQVPVATTEDIEREIPGLAGRADALFIAFNALMVANRTKIATLALANQLPTSCPIRNFVVAGGLQSYGFSLPNEFRRAAPFVDKILRGAKPSDLPIEQPTVFELIINLTTAKALGLSLPAALLARADELIE